MCNVYFFSQAAFKTFSLYLFFTSLTIMCLSVCAHTFVYMYMYLVWRLLNFLIYLLTLLTTIRKFSTGDFFNHFFLFHSLWNSSETFYSFIREGVFFNLKKNYFREEGRKKQRNTDWLPPECAWTRGLTLTSAWVCALTGNRTRHFWVFGTTFPPTKPHQPEPQVKHFRPFDVQRSLKLVHFFP